MMQRDTKWLRELEKEIIYTLPRWWHPFEILVTLVVTKDEYCICVVF